MNCLFKCTHCFAKKLELDDGTKRSTTLLFIYYYCFLLACVAEERLEPSRAGHFCWGRPDDPPSLIHPEGWHVPEEFRNSTPTNEDAIRGGGSKAQETTNSRGWQNYLGPTSTISMCPRNYKLLATTIMYP